MDDPNLKGVELSGSKKRTGFFLGTIILTLIIAAAVILFFLGKKG